MEHQLAVAKNAAQIGAVVLAALAMAILTFIMIGMADILFNSLVAMLLNLTVIVFFVAASWHYRLFLGRNLRLRL